MFNLTKKTIVATSLLVLSTLQHALASSHNSDECDQRVVLLSVGVGLTDPASIHPKDASTQPKAASPQPITNDATEPPTKTEFQCSNPELYQMDSCAFTKLMDYVSTLIDPRIIRVVCRQWKNFLDQNNNPDAPSKFYQQGLLMQRSLKIWWAIEDQKRFNNIILRYMGPVAEDLRQIYNAFVMPPTYSMRVRITTNVQEFLKTDGDNAYKTIVLAVLYHKAVKAINSMEASHPFASVVREWDVSQAAVGIFFKWGNDDAAKHGVHYVTNVSFGKKSMMVSLGEIWKKRLWRRGEWPLLNSYDVDLTCFWLSFWDKI